MSNDLGMMRGIPQPICAICGSQGAPLYGELTDDLFRSVAGTWSMVRCPRTDCGLAWLNPMPEPSQLWMAYRKYYTHRPAAAGRGASDRLYRILLNATPLGRARRRVDSMYLNEAPGRLLEVGCGSGERLLHFRELGWEVEGQEVDQAAAQIARTEHNLVVHLGEIANLDLQPASYDAVVLNHVLEHVHDPLAFLGAIRLLVRPGGVMVVTTPNTRSVGHRVFRKRWLGLDPPRHLHLFTADALARAATMAGFDQHRTWTTAARAQAVGRGSIELWWRGSRTDMSRRNLWLDGVALVIQVVFGAWWLVARGSGEELVLRAVRSHP